jgi:hypothetical protein
MGGAGARTAGQFHAMAAAWPSLLFRLRFEVGGYKMHAPDLGEMVRGWNRLLRPLKTFGVW